MESADVPNCTICLCPVVENNGESTARLQCSHVFHLACIGSAFNAKGVMQCPNCRHIEDSEWLSPGGDFEEMEEIISIESEEELANEFLDMQPSELLWYMFNGFDEVLSPYGGTGPFQSPYQPQTFSNYQAYQENWGAPDPYVQLGNRGGIASESGYTLPTPPALARRGHVIGPSVHAQLPPQHPQLVYHHEHNEAVPQTYGLRYQNNNAPIIRNIRASSPHTQNPPHPPTHFPVHGPMGSSSTRRTMTTAVVTPPPSPYIGTYGSAPFLGHMGASGSTGLQFPPLTSGGRSHGGLGPVVLEDETSGSYGHTMYEFL